MKDGRFVDLEDYLKRIRDAGLIPGSATHNGERLKMMDEGGYDISVFVTPVNKMGFYMNPSQEVALDAVNNSKSSKTMYVHILNVSLNKVLLEGS